MNLFAFRKIAAVIQSVQKCAFGASQCWKIFNKNSSLDTKVWICWVLLTHHRWADWLFAAYLLRSCSFLTCSPVLPEELWQYCSVVRAKWRWTLYPAVWRRYRRFCRECKTNVLWVHRNCSQANAGCGMTSIWDKFANLRLHNVLKVLNFRRRAAA